MNSIVVKIVPGQDLNAVPNKVTPARTRSNAANYGIFGVDGQRARGINDQAVGPAAAGLGRDLKYAHRRRGVHKNGRGLR